MTRFEHQTIRTVMDTNNSFVTLHISTHILFTGMVLDSSQSNISKLQLVSMFWENATLQADYSVGCMTSDIPREHGVVSHAAEEEIPCNEDLIRIVTNELIKHFDFVTTWYSSIFKLLFLCQF